MHTRRCTIIEHEQILLCLICEWTQLIACNDTIINSAKNNMLVEPNMKVISSHIFIMKLVSDKSKIPWAFAVWTCRNWSCLCLSQVYLFRYNLVGSSMHSSWEGIKALICVVVFTTIQTKGGAKQTKLLRQTLINRQNRREIKVSDKVSARLRKVLLVIQAGNRWMRSKL